MVPLTPRPKQRDTPSPCVSLSPSVLPAHSSSCSGLQCECSHPWVLSVFSQLLSWPSLSSFTWDVRTGCIFVAQQMLCWVERGESPRAQVLPGPVRGKAGLVFSEASGGSHPTAGWHLLSPRPLLPPIHVTSYTGKSSEPHTWAPKSLRKHGY